MNLISNISLIGLLFIFLALTSCKVNKKTQSSNGIDCIKLVERLGNEEPEKLGKCMEQKDVATVLAMREFLIKKGYEVETEEETEEELNPSLKKAMTQFMKDNSLPVSPNGMMEYFEIDEDKIDEEFCTCVMKELRDIRNKK